MTSGDNNLIAGMQVFSDETFFEWTKITGAPPLIGLSA